VRASSFDNIFDDADLTESSRRNKKSGALAPPNGGARSARQNVNGAHFSRMRSARLKRDRAGVVHRQQRYSCIIFGLSRRCNKSAPRSTRDNGLM